jgi:excisionase family DNA binding protein
MNLLTTKEVCEKLKCSVYIVDRMHKLGMLPKIKIGTKTVRYKVEDLDKLIERRRLV